ncbi:MAG: hypothetical protein GQ574_15980 [Crocinitomix sp.]|nr:hypothetical protein [Crocinitomix sp.]
MKSTSIVFLFLCFALISCKKKTEEEIQEAFPEKTNPNLVHFGYTLVDVYWDDPTDDTDKINYIDEVAPFSNIADLLVISPEDDIRERLTLMQSYDVKGVLHLHELFFELVGTTESMSGSDYDLRTDYKERWDTFISTNEFDTDISALGCFYLGEEPTWNSISTEDFTAASDYIKATIPSIPILLVEAYPAVEALEVPASVDWIGFDHYFLADPATNSDFQAELTDLKSKKLDHQDLILVLDAHYIPFAHGSSGISKLDMDVVARNYYKLANAETDVVGMIGYHWPSGFDFASAIGARGLPSNVLSEHKRIGKAITGK